MFDAPDSRDQGGQEQMELEQVYRQVPASDVELEDGEVHFDNKVLSSIDFQGLVSSIARR